MAARHGNSTLNSVIGPTDCKPTYCFLPSIAILSWGYFLDADRTAVVYSLLVVGVNLFRQ